MISSAETTTSIGPNGVDQWASASNRSNQSDAAAVAAVAADGAIYEMSSFYCACIMACLCLIGLLGNLLSVYVFSRKTMRTSSINILLTGLSLTDFVLLLIVVPIFAIPALAEFTETSDGLADFIHFTIAYVYPLALILQTSSVWIFILITVERFMAVCWPLKVGQYCTVDRSKVGLAAVFVLACGYNLVRFWEYTTAACPSDVICGSLYTVPLLRSNPGYWLWYGTVLYLVTQFMVPFLAIAFLNSMVVYKMYQVSIASFMLLYRTYSN